MADIFEAFSRGIAAGQGVKAHQEAQEENKLRKAILKHQMDALKLEDQLRERDIALQNFQFMQGTPQADVPNADPGVPIAPAGALGAGVSLPEAPRQMAPVQIPGVNVPELGINQPGVSRRPQTAEEAARAQLLEKLSQPMKLAAGEVFGSPATGVLMRGTPRTGNVGGALMNLETGDVITPAAEKDVPIQQQLLNALRKGDTKEARLIQESLRIAKTADDDPLLAELRQMRIENLRRQVNSPDMSPAQFNMANRLADDFARDSKDFVARAQSYGTVLAAGKEQTPASDLSMIFAYMKMLDPGSVVREGEFATAQNAAAIPDRIRNVYNRVINGTRLTPEQRGDFTKQARSIYDSAKSRQNALVKTYSGRAVATKVPVDMVVTDYSAGVEPASSGAVTVKAPDGVSYTFPTQAAADAFKKAAGIK